MRTIARGIRFDIRFLQRVMMLIGAMKRQKLNTQLEKCIETHGNRLTFSTVVYCLALESLASYEIIYMGLGVEDKNTVPRRKN